MEENAMLELDNLLKEYGIEGEFTDKEKFIILGKIIEHHDVDRDYEDFKYSKIPEEAKTDDVKQKYASTIRNLDIKIMNAQDYYYMLETKFKKERKEKRKKKLQKIIGVFKKSN